MSISADDVNAILEAYSEKMTKVSVKAVGIQVGLMSGISLAVLLAFSFFRPREKKIYEPKIKYRLSSDEEEMPPPISNGFFSWLTPLITKNDIDLVNTIGVDAVAFLEFLNLLKWMFTAITILVCGVLIPINVVYTLKDTSASSVAKRNALSILTISGLSGTVLFVHVGIVYLITFIIMFFSWFYWRRMLKLRAEWFRSTKYQRSIQSRSLMITGVRKEYQSDEGLRDLMRLIRGGNEKIGMGIQSGTIGRDLKNYPALVEEYNDTVKDFEKILAKYLKGGTIEGKKRPMIRKGGFFFNKIGGQKMDAIEYYAVKLGRMHDIIEVRKQDIDELKPKHSKHSKHHLNQSKSGKAEKPMKVKIPAENYGFISMMDAAQAHAIASTHKGAQKDMLGARIMLAPAPGDIIWGNCSLSPADRRASKAWGFMLLCIVCFFNTIPLIVVAAIANLTSLSVYIKWLAKWSNAGPAGEWSFSVVSGVLPPAISALFGILLPVLIRKLSKYQGALSKTEVDRAVLTRLFTFLVISQIFIFSLLAVIAQMIAQIEIEVTEKKSFANIISGLSNLPDAIQQTYVAQSTYWLTFFPMRGFLIFFELAQLIKLITLSLRTALFAKTPRDIKEWTRPPVFDYAVIYANILFLVAIALIYAPLAPLVTLFATAIFWFSSYIYKYQLLYVYVSKNESGGRSWNVACNRVFVGAVLMQALMILTITLQRRKWQDSIAAVPPFLVLIAFKIFVLRPYGNQFRYFTPTYEENQGLMDEARHSYKQRFLHPALRDNQLYTVMVHSDQEALTQQLLSEYSPNLRREIVGVKERDLAYDPTKDKDKLTNAGLDDDTSTVAGDADSMRAPLRPGFHTRNTSDSTLSGVMVGPEDSTTDLMAAPGYAGGGGGWYNTKKEHLLLNDNESSADLGGANYGYASPYGQQSFQPPVHDTGYAADGAPTRPLLHGRQSSEPESYQMQSFNTSSHIRQDLAQGYEPERLEPVVLDRRPEEDTYGDEAGHDYQQPYRQPSSRRF